VQQPHNASRACTHHQVEEHTSRLARPPSIKLGPLPHLPEVFEWTKTCKPQTYSHRNHLGIVTDVRDKCKPLQRLPYASWYIYLLYVPGRYPLDYVDHLLFKGKHTTKLFLQRRFSFEYHCTN